MSVIIGIFIFLLLVNINIKHVLLPQLLKYNPPQNPLNVSTYFYGGFIDIIQDFLLSL